MTDPAGRKSVHYLGTYAHPSCSERFCCIKGCTVAGAVYVAALWEGVRVFRFCLEHAAVAQAALSDPKALSLASRRSEGQYRNRKCQNFVYPLHGRHWE